MKKILFIGLIAFLAACSPKGSLFLVNSLTTDCGDEEPTTCLLIATAETPEKADWQTCATIEGFDFAPGYFYKLRLAETIDGSHSSFKLLDLLEKTPDPKFELNGKWIVTKIGGKTVSSDDENKQAFLLIDLNNMGISGKDGCNNLSSRIVSLDETTIELGPIAATRMFCPDMSVADPFNAALIQVKNYRIKNDILVFQNETGKDLVVFKKEK